MGLDFKHQIIIERVAQEVFPFVADFENNPSWQQGMVSCRWTSKGPGQVGATYVQEARFMGKQIDTHFVVTEFIDGQAVSIESTQSTFPIQVTRSVEPLEQTPQYSLVRAHIRGQPQGLLRLFSPMVKLSVKKDYRVLKQLLEASGA